MGALWCWCKSKKKKQPEAEPKKSIPNIEKVDQESIRPQTPPPTTFEILHSVTEKKDSSPKKK